MLENREMEAQKMSNSDNTSFIRGLGLGMAVGSAIGIAVKSGIKTAPAKNALGKALKSMGETVENVTSMFGL